MMLVVLLGWDQKYVLVMYDICFTYYIMLIYSIIHIISIVYIL